MSPNILRCDIYSLHERFVAPSKILEIEFRSCCLAQFLHLSLVCVKLDTFHRLGLLYRNHLGRRLGDNRLINWRLNYWHLWLVLRGDRLRLRRLIGWWDLLWGRLNEIIVLRGWLNCIWLYHWLIIV